MAKKPKYYVATLVRGRSYTVYDTSTNPSLRWMNGDSKTVDEELKKKLERAKDKGTVQHGDKTVARELKKFRIREATPAEIAALTTKKDRWSGDDKVEDEDEDEDDVDGNEEDDAEDEEDGADEEDEEDDSDDEDEDEDEEEVTEPPKKTVAKKAAKKAAKKKAKGK